MQYSNKRTQDSKQSEAIFVRKLHQPEHFYVSSNQCTSSYEVFQSIVTIQTLAIKLYDSWVLQGDIVGELSAIADDLIIYAMNPSLTSRLEESFIIVFLLLMLSDDAVYDGNHRKKKVKNGKKKKKK